MSVGASLRGLRILVTRPAAQADTLCRLLEARGAEVVRLPLQVIEPTRQAAAAAQTLAAARDADAWIFTSANAVQYARRLDAGLWPAAIAVGAATAAALEGLSSGAGHPAQAYSSEAVLALPELQQVQGRRFLIVSGEGGRTLIADTLRGRGARVERVAVYRRVDLPHAASAVAAALAAVDVAIITSGEALARLVALATPQAAALRQLQLVVPSQRVVEQARQLGFERAPLLPEHVADAAYVRCLESWHR